MCKRSIQTLVLFLCLIVGFSAGAQEKEGKAVGKKQQKTSGTEALGWRLGVQSYSFNQFTFFDAVDKSASMGMNMIEAYPGQRISKDFEGDMDYKMDEAARKKVREKLASAKIKLVNFGVVGAGSEEEWRALFQFAKDMGIETIVSEPDEKDADFLEKLCDEFQINLAIHNHPKPSHYWNPDTVLKFVEGRSKRMGACADTGHWARSGLVPLECVKKLKGRVISSHLKDLNVASDKGHDVPWGAGACNIAGVLAELKRQGYKGTFSAEYEYNWENSVPEITLCAQYFRLAASALADEGYKPLLKEDLSDAVMEKGGWAFENGVLTSKGKGDVWTKARYGDFALDLEFKCAAETNSGVFLRCASIENWLHSSIEVQILQPWLGDQPRENCGGVFDCLGPGKKMIKPAGGWNHYLIIAKANRIYVVFNGEQVLNMDLDQWTEAHKNPDGTPNKFDNAYKDMAREGCIGLQYHGQPISFRNLKVKPL